MHLGLILVTGALLASAGAALAAPEQPAVDTPKAAVRTSPADLREDPTRGNPDFAKLDPTLQAMARLIGGAWTAETDLGDGKPAIVEVRHRWALNNRAIHSTAVLGKGRPDAVTAEAYYGWDPVNKNVYYIDFHGASNVFKGTIRAEGKTLVTEFSRMIGPAAKWRATDEFLDDDTLVFTVHDVMEGEPKEVVGLKMKRTW